MTLSFSQKWPERMGEFAGQPNCFIEKIWEGLINNKISHDLAYDTYKVLHLHQLDDYWDGNPMVYAPKLHTIREDKSDRWKAGNDIHMVINNRTKDRFQFAPVVKCVSVQEIEIVYDNKCSDYPAVVIDGKPLFIYHEEDKKILTNLAINDGFPSVEAFFQFFDRSFVGKIVHWTDLKY